MAATESNDLAAEELDLISSSDLCIVHSTFEQELLKELRPGCRVVCFPWIYEPRGNGKPFDQRSGLIFVGGYRHPPNVDAVEYYVESIHPLLKDRLPSDARFIAAGSSPPPSFSTLAGQGIDVTGYVEDISPLLFGARVMVVPLRYGAGIKGKILSAMAHGLPIVTTTVGAEGMGLVDGEHVLIADEPAAFAEAVQRLYESSELWRKLQRAGLDYISATTSRRVGLKTVASVLEQLDLPFVDRDVPVSGGDDDARLAPIGSRLELSSVTKLADAGRRSQPAFAGSIDLLVLPEDVPALAELPDAIAAAARYSEFSRSAAGAKKIVAIADTTDSNSLRTLGLNLRQHLPTDATCVVVFAPPRLEGSSHGYRLIAPFSDQEVREIGAPFHEQFAELLRVARSHTHMAGRQKPHGISVPNDPSYFCGRGTRTALAGT